jgi:hypothetical protein
MQMYVQRVSSDEARMIEITMGVTSLLDQIDTDIAALRAKYEPQAEAA